MLENVAEFIGASEPSLRLLVSILLGYPLSYAYVKCFKQVPPYWKHVFFATSGFLIGFYNFGLDMVHSLIGILVTYLTLQIAGGSSLSIIFSFLFHMTYLLVGYHVTGTTDYDIKWTMPQCVLVLRHIALAFDVADGKVPEEKMSNDQKTNHLKTVPSLLEIAAQTYFPGGFLVGPQFSMRRYLDFVCNRFDDKASGKGDSVKAGIIRGLTGILYVAIYQFGSVLVPDSILTSDYFNESSLLLKLIITGLWCKIVMYKYISCWLISEGVCIVSGLTFNGVVEGRNLWDGCANVKLRIYENATRFGQMVPSFNINTNTWAAQYVYKRCKFLGNKMASQLLTLGFLAVWHGWHSGYYMCFFMEFIIMKWEKDAEYVISKNPGLEKFLNQKPMKMLLYICGKLYFLTFMGYSLVPFVLLKSEKWIPVLQSLYFSGHVLFLSLDLVLPLFGRFLAPRRRKEE